MSCHLFLIIIFTLFYELSNGKNYESNITPNIINEDSNIYNLREWIDFSKILYLFFCQFYPWEKMKQNREIFIN